MDDLKTGKAQRLVSLKAAIAWAMLAWSGHSFALDAGVIVTESGVNEPLRAQIPLVDSGSLDLDQLTIQIAPAEIYQTMGIERLPVIDRLQLMLARRDDGAPIVKVTTADPVEQPYVNFLLQFDWPQGHIVRQFTAMLDAPVFLGERGKQVDAAKSARDEQNSENTQINTNESGIASGPVKFGDYLWDIANRTKPSDVTVEQMMLAYLKFNREAFFGDNVNMLKAGAVLRLERDSSLQEISAEEAIKEISRQHKEWLNYKQQRQLARRGRVTNEGVAKGAIGGGGKVTAVEPGARLQLEDVQQPSGAEVAKSQKTIDDLRKRLAESEKRNAELQRKLNNATGEDRAVDAPLTVESEDLAEVQDSQASDENATELFRDPITIGFIFGLIAVAGLMAWGMTRRGRVTRRKDFDLFPNTRTMPATEQSSDDFDVVVVTKKKEQPSEAISSIDESPSDKVKSVSAEVSEEDSKILETHLTVVAPAEDSSEISTYQAPPAESGSLTIEFPPEKLSPNTISKVSESVLSGSEVTPSEQEVSAILSELDLNSVNSSPQEASPVMSIVAEQESETMRSTGDLDAIAEADIYLTYDKFEQAERFLKEAIDRSPERQDLKLKLLETYYLQQKQEAFEEQAEILYAALAGDEQNIVWLRAKEMGHEIAPQNPLFSSVAGIASQNSTEISTQLVETEIGSYIGPAFDPETIPPPLPDSELMDSQVPSDQKVYLPEMKSAASSSHSQEQDVPSREASTLLAEAAEELSDLERSQHALGELPETEPRSEPLILDEANSGVDDRAEPQLGALLTLPDSEKDEPSSMIPVATTRFEEPDSNQAGALAAEQPEPMFDALDSDAVNAVTEQVEVRASEHLTLPDSEGDEPLNQKSESSPDEIVVSGFSQSGTQLHEVELPEDKISISQISAGDDTDAMVDGEVAHSDAVSRVDISNLEPNTKLNLNEPVSKIQPEMPTPIESRLTDMGYVEPISTVHNSNLAYASVFEVPMGPAPSKFTEAVDELSADGKTLAEAMEQERTLTLDEMEIPTVEDASDDKPIEALMDEIDSIDVPLQQIELAKRESEVMSDPSLPSQVEAVSLELEQEPEVSSLDITQTLTEIGPLSSVASSQWDEEVTEIKMADDEKQALSEIAETYSRSQAPYGETEVMEELAQAQREREQAKATPEQDEFEQDIETLMEQEDAKVDEEFSASLAAVGTDEALPVLESERSSQLEDSSFFLLNDEIGTKLDLARAYIEMGDAKHATKLLKEVQSEGDARQREEADQLMSAVSA